jgi:hypothetical protein
MQVRKYQTADGHCIIKTDTYVHTLEYVQKLKEIALLDFSDLKDSEIQIKVYNDDRWKSQTGIEFKAGNQQGYYINTKLVKPLENFPEYLEIESCSHPEYELLSKLPCCLN